jgi:hypothetical protein
MRAVDPLPPQPVLEAGVAIIAALTMFEPDGLGSRMPCDAPGGRARRRLRRMPNPPVRSGKVVKITGL